MVYLKLIVNPKNKIISNGRLVTLSTSMTQNNEICEFYLDEKNVTPHEPVSVKYTAVKYREGTSKKMNRIAEMCATDGDNYAVNFIDFDKKSADRFLGRILRESHDNEDVKLTSEYDVGHYVYHSRENIVTQGYEVELTESPMFTVLSVRGGITVKRNGAVEKAQKNKAAHLSDRSKSLLEVDDVSQTVNSFTQRCAAKCQTTTPRMNEVGVQVYDFDVIGGRPQTATEMKPNVSSTAIEKVSGGFDENQTVLVKRILAQNALNADRVGQHYINDDRPEESDFLTPDVFAGISCTYRFTLTLPGHLNRGLAVRCVAWNVQETHLIAVAYSQLMYHDSRDVPNALAVWSTKNPDTPERFYEFGELVITCITFSPGYPNRLVIGFRCGSITLIDISSKTLQILLQVSKKFSLATTGIIDLFWSVRLENDSHDSSYACLVACSLSGRVARYNYQQDMLEEKILMQLAHVDDGLVRSLYDGGSDGHSVAHPTSVSRPSKAVELHKGTAYLIGTANGLVYSCLYDNAVKYRAKIRAHMGPIRSLERSPFSTDLFLTTSCDCKVKIWIGDIFKEPLIIVQAEEQIERAIWSRTEPTVIVSIVGNNTLHGWDFNQSKDNPILVMRLPRSGGGRNKWSGLEFTPNGKHLCVYDVDGNAAVYVWLDTQTTAESSHEVQLMYCIVKNLYGRPLESKTLIEQRPEYGNVFERLHNEKQKIYFA